MNHTVMGLKSRDNDEAVALQSVHAQGQLQGLVLRMTLRQVYRNDSDKNLECVYTFALSWGSVLLSMAVELNGKRLSGSVVEKHTAEVTYENAIQSGDLPVMLYNVPGRSGADMLHDTVLRLAEVPGTPALLVLTASHYAAGSHLEALPCVHCCCLYPCSVSLT